MKCVARFGTQGSDCGVCRKGAGSNSIKCNQCSQWIHGRCSGVSGKLHNVADLLRKRCVDGQLCREGLAVKEIMISSLDKL